MKDQECIQFLQWAFPRLRMRWQGFRKVRGQVCKRVARRLRELGLPDVSAYQAHLEHNPPEWTVLDSLCRITISRFSRDREVFQFLEREVLPKLAGLSRSRGDRELRCWSIGCASGEEPYTLALLWTASLKSTFADMGMKVIATDADRGMIERAKKGCYSLSSVRELPRERLDTWFIKTGDGYCVKETVRGTVEFLEEDIRAAAPEDTFHLILCRNMAFTYFDGPLQREVLGKIREKLLPRGSLVIGSHESLPSGAEGFEPWPGKPGIYRRT